MTQKPEFQAPGSGENPWEHGSAGILKKKKEKTWVCFQVWNPLGLHRTGGTKMGFHSQPRIAPIPRSTPARPGGGVGGEVGQFPRAGKRQK